MKYMFSHVNPLIAGSELSKLFSMWPTTAAADGDDDCCMPWRHFLKKEGRINEEQWLWMVVNSRISFLFYQITVRKLLLAPSLVAILIAAASFHALNWHLSPRLSRLNRRVGLVCGQV